MPDLFLKKICYEPYRLFFPLGVLIALAGTGHWAFYAYGIMPRYSAFFHSSLQTQAYMVSFVMGFLMTAMPRFASARSAQWWEILIVLGLILGNTVTLSFGRWILSQSCFAGVLIFLLVFAATRIGSKSKPVSVSPPLEFIWIPIAVIHGLAGSFLMILHQLERIPQPWVQAAKLMNEQGFILCIVIGIGGFLAPRLMGTFRIYAKPGQGPDHPEVIKIRRRVIGFHLIAGLLFFASFWIGAYQLNLSYFLRALVITAEYCWTCSWIRFPRTPEFYTKLLWVSLWMVVAGSWLTFLLPAYRSAMLHVLFIGGLSLMIFAVATMVLLSHAGESEKLRKPLPVLWIAGLGIAVSLTFRLAAAFFPESYFSFLGASSLIWVAAALPWFFFALSKMKSAVSAEKLESCHEEARQKVIESRKINPSHTGCCEHKKPSTS